CAFIRGGIDEATFWQRVPREGASDGFDAARHLDRIGVANQTTMLASESIAIGRRIGAALEARHGADGVERFRSFDTICSATQDRQDAIHAMIAETPPDLVLVIGGYNSSNT